MALGAKENNGGENMNFNLPKSEVKCLIEYLVKAEEELKWHQCISIKNIRTRFVIAVAKDDKHHKEVGKDG